MFYSDNTNYMGRWVNDKRSGYGVLRNNLEGWRFLSLWKEDKKHGRGIFIRLVNKMMLKRQPIITASKRQPSITTPQRQPFTTRP